MKAAIVAQHLKTLGFPVLSVSEGSDLEDGEVKITDAVHVQVHYYGSFANVVVENGDGTFTFHPDRSMRVDFPRLSQDLRDVGVHA